jgi:hypothetical protein
MRVPSAWWIGLGLSAWLSAAPLVLGQQGQAEQSLARLFSQETAVYLELRGPGQAAEKLAELLRGSVLENYPLGLAKLRERGVEIGAWVETLGLFLSPEGLREVQKFQGLALGLQASDAAGDSPYVLALRPGQSTAAALLLRQMLAQASAEPVEEVEGVTVYRCHLPRVASMQMMRADARGLQLQIQRQMAQIKQQMRRMMQQQMPGAILPAWEGVAVDFAWLPDLVVLGKPALVKEVLARAKGQAKESLADQQTFQQASREFGDKAGVFLYGDLRLVQTQLAKLEGGQPRWSILLRQGIQPETMQPVSGGLTFDDDGPRLRLATSLSGEGGLSVWVRETAVPPVLLHYVPARLQAALLLSHPKGQEAWQRLVTLAEAWMRAADPNQAGWGRRLAQLEDELKIKFGTEVWDRLEQVVLAQGRDKGDGSVPGLLGVFACADEETARQLLQQAWPKVLEAVSGQAVVPTVKEMQGRTVTSADLGTLGVISATRNGSVIVVSNDADLLNEAVTAGERKQGMLGEARIAAAIAQAEGAAVVLLARPQWLADFLYGRGMLAQSLFQPVAGGPGVPGVVAGVVQQGQIQMQIQIGGVGPVVPPQVPGQAAAEPEEGFDLAPVVVSLRRKGKEVVLEARFSEARPGVARAVDFLLQRQADAVGPFAGGFVPPVRAVPQIQIAPLPAVPQPAVPLPAQPPAVPRREPPAKEFPAKEPPAQKDQQ